MISSEDLQDDTSWILLFSLTAVTAQLIRFSMDLIQVASQPIMADKEMSHSVGVGGIGAAHNKYTISTDDKATASSRLKTNKDDDATPKESSEDQPLLSSNPSAESKAPMRWNRAGRIGITATVWLLLTVFYSYSAIVPSQNRSIPLGGLFTAAFLAATDFIFLLRDPDYRRYNSVTRFFHLLANSMVWLEFIWRSVVQTDHSSSWIPILPTDRLSLYLLAAVTLQLLIVLLLQGGCLLPSSPNRTMNASSSTSDDDEDPKTESQKSTVPTQALLPLLQPYFWPGATVDSPAWLNRLRAVSTWICVLGSKICNLSSPLLLGWASTALAHEDYHATIVYSCGYAALSWLGGLLKEGQSLVYLRVAQAAYVQLAVTAFGHLHSLSLDWHLRKKLGLVLRSMSRGISACDTLMKYLFLWLLPALVECLVVCLIFATYFSYWPLAVTVFYFVFLYTVWTILVTLWRKKFRKALVKSDNEMEDRFVDSMINFETVKYFTAEQYEKERFEQAVSDFQSGSVNVQASLSFLNISQQVILKACLAVALSLSAHAIQERHLCCQEKGCDSLISDCCLQSGCPGMQVGDFVAVLTYTLNLFAPLNFLGSVYNSVVMALIDLNSMSELLAESPDVTDAPDAIELPSRKSDVAVEFDNVHFHYPTQASSSGLKGLSFQMKRGTTTAIVGPTGAGKTTVSRLLFRFYDVLGGTVKVNGVDVQKVTQKSLRQAIGVVPQTASLFNDSIKANLLYGKRDATDAELEQAAKDAQLLHFIESLSDKWDTVVGDRGLKLSGGEKQRAAITRCLLKNPDFVLLDEATSALDTITEKSVQEALDRLGEDRTVLVIAHRLGTIRNADNIVVLKDGVAAEQGTHDELMAKNGIYAAMWNMQLHASTATSSYESAR